MSNNAGMKKIPIGYRGDPRITYAHAGWEDARQGKPFDYNLVDSAPRPDQAHAYENNRLRVFALMAKGHKITKWNVAEKVPPKIKAAITLANNINMQSRIEGTGFWPIGKAGWQS
jgi:hypothetical protein